jgi:hypothetical protein
MWSYIIRDKGELSRNAIRRQEREEGSWCLREQSQ